MLQAERMEKMRDYMMEHKYAGISELAEALDSSPATIRRCLAELEAKQVVERTRGGAVLLGSGNTYEHPYSIKRRRNEAEKRRIAAYAASLVSTSNSLYLDASSTVREMTTPLKSAKQLTVCTNDVLIAGDLSSASDLIVIVTGGVMRQGFYSLSGYLTDRAISSMQLDYAFMGIDAISDRSGMMLTNMEELGTKQKIARMAGKTIVLADHEKFDRSAFLNVWSFTDISMVVTGRELSDEQYDRYSELGLRIERV